MTPAHRTLATTLALATATLLAAAGCAHHAGGDTIGNHGDPAAAAPPAVSLADDVAVLARSAQHGEQETDWTQRVTFLGWTADRRVVYRALVCDPDELGGRGPYCELQVCAIGEAAADPDNSPCDQAASFELYGDIAFAADEVTQAADEAMAKLGPLTAGTPRSLDAVVLSVAGHALTATILDAPPREIIAADSEDAELGVLGATASYVGDSADGRCRAAVGVASYLSDYEGVKGHVPWPFAAVRCKP